MRFRLIFFLFFFIFSQWVNGQSDSIKLSQSDSAMIQKKAQKRFRDPRRASLLSAIFPGAGQLYNRKYWKLPIVFGAAFTLGYYIHFNNEQYIFSRDEYILVKNGKQNITGYSSEQLVRLREYWRRNRDFLVIISALTYLLNIADAAVDAHFSTFDVSDDLSLKLKPELYIAGRQPVYGLGLALTFK